MLIDDVIDYLDSYKIAQIMTNDKTLFINTYNSEVMLTRRHFTCFIIPTKKNIKIEMLIGHKEYNDLCKQLDTYMKKIHIAGPRGVTRVFKIEFKGSQFEAFKRFMNDYIFNYFIRRG